MKNALFLILLLTSILGISQDASYKLDDFQLLGRAELLRTDAFLLTENLHFQSGSIWYPEQLDLKKPFSIVMDIFFGCSDGGADGMVFVLTTEPGLGAMSNGIGFRGISPSLGLELDTYQNGIYGDPHADHIGLMLNGATRHRSGLSEGKPLLNYGGNVEDCKYHSFQVDWNPRRQKLSAAFDGEWILNQKIDIAEMVFKGNETVYWGITASTGKNRNRQLVKLRRMRFTEVMKKKDRELILPELITFDTIREDVIAANSIGLDRMMDYMYKNPNFYLVLEHHQNASKDKLERIIEYLKDQGLDENHIIIIEKSTEALESAKKITATLREIKV